MAPRHGLKALLGVALLFAGGHACSGDARDGADPWAAEVRAAASRATSDFEREVLEDGVISRAEYDEADDRYLACARSQGVRIEAEPRDGLFSYSMATSDEMDAVDELCSRGTTILIESLYAAMRVNPEHGDLDELVPACLVKRGLAPEGYGRAEFVQDQTDGFDLDTEDPRFQECLTDPTGRS